jgi:hypothetical protein
MDLILAKALSQIKNEKRKIVVLPANGTGGRIGHIGRMGNVAIGFNAIMLQCVQSATNVGIGLYAENGVDFLFRQCGQ